MPVVCASDVFLHCKPGDVDALLHTCKVANEDPSQLKDMHACCIHSETCLTSANMVVLKFCYMHLQLLILVLLQKQDVATTHAFVGLRLAKRECITYWHNKT